MNPWKHVTPKSEYNDISQNYYVCCRLHMPSHSHGIRESHSVIVRRVRSHSQASLPGSLGIGPDEPGTTLSRRNDSLGFVFSPVSIILLQKIRTKTSLDQFCIRCIQIYRLLWSSARVRNKLLTNHRRDIKTQGEGRWTRQGWIYPMFDVIRHIIIIPLQNQRNSKGEKEISQHKREHNAPIHVQWGPKISIQPYLPHDNKLLNNIDTLKFQMNLKMLICVKLDCSVTRNRKYIPRSP